MTSQETRFVFARPTVKELARFMSKITIRGHDECWEWTGARIRFGYGHFTLNRRSVKSHRLAVEWLANMPIGDLIVLHRCDNPPCCNPGHLAIGTHGDNSQDMLAKGRQYGGETHHLARLGDDQIAQIIELRRQRMTVPKIASIVGCSWPHVSYVLSGKTRTQGAELPERFKLTTAKITDEQVIEAQKLHASGVKQSDIAKRFGISQAGVSHAINHRFPKLAVTHRRLP
jgi:predicted transcriptional regulator